MHDVIYPAVGIFFYKEDLLGSFYIYLSYGSGVPVGAGTVKQLTAQIFFQFEELLIEGGLGYKEIFGRFGYVVCLGDLHYIFKLF